MLQNLELHFIHRDLESTTRDQKNNELHILTEES